MSNVNLDQKKAIGDAKERGQTVIKGGPFRLLLDLDAPRAVAIYEANLKNLQDGGLFRKSSEAKPFFTLKETKRWKSKSGVGTHVVLRISRPLPLVERLLLQACLGSDLKKELYSYARYWTGTSEPSMLFKPPQNAIPPKKKLPPLTPAFKNVNDDFYNVNDDFDDDIPF